MNTEDRITKAKVALLISQPWFGQLSCYLTLIENNKIDSAAIDERGYFYYNLKFIEKCSDIELKGLVMHEILHLAYQHPFRIQHRDQTIFNIAADLKINYELIRLDNHTLELPKGGLMPNWEGKWSCANAKVENIGEKTTEQIYEELKKQAFKIPSFILDLLKGQSGVEEIPPSQIPVLAREWQARIDAANTQLRGDVPEGLARELKALENPELPWIQILRQRLRKMTRERTWKKVNKKYLPFYFPASTVIKGLTAVVAIDTSGSISQEQLTKSLSEIWGLAETFRSVRLFLMTCDADVWDTMELRNGNKAKLLKMKMRGGGGTDFRPVFKLVKKNYQNMIDCLVFFTDGYGTFPEKKPFYPVYWITDSRDVKYPFGKVIYLKE